MVNKTFGSIKIKLLSFYIKCIKGNKITLLIIGLFIMLSDVLVCGIITCLSVLYFNHKQQWFITIYIYIYMRVYSKKKKNESEK